MVALSAKFLVAVPVKLWWQFTRSFNGTCGGITQRFEVAVSVEFLVAVPMELCVVVPLNFIVGH